MSLVQPLYRPIHGEALRLGERTERRPGKQGLRIHGIGDVSSGCLKRSTVAPTL